MDDPHANAPAFAARYQIRDTSTGEARIRAETVHYLGLCDYYWTDGNMSCDCNRALEFERAAGHEPEVLGADSVGCGDGRFVLEWVEIDGVRIVENDEATALANRGDNGDW